MPLPDKVDVVTGEEDENVLYCHRAKLFILKDGEFKERGLGDVKILQHTKVYNCFWHTIALIFLNVKFLERNLFRYFFDFDCKLIEKNS